MLLSTSGDNPCMREIFGLVMTSLPSVRTQCHNTYALVFVRREVEWRGEFKKSNRNTKEQNTKSIFMYSLDMLTNVERRERERDKANKKAVTI